MPGGDQDLAGDGRLGGVGLAVAALGLLVEPMPRGCSAAMPGVAARRRDEADHRGGRHDRIGARNPHRSPDENSSGLRPRRRFPRRATERDGALRSDWGAGPRRGAVPLVGSFVGSNTAPNDSLRDWPGLRAEPLLPAISSHNWIAKRPVSRYERSLHTRHVAARDIEAELLDMHTGPIEVGSRRESRSRRLTNESARNSEPFVEERDVGLNPGSPGYDAGL